MFETRKEEASVEEIRELKERLERERPVEWEAFPDIGLYMDQLISYMPRQLIHYGEGESLTSAMVNNYIKDGAMPRAEGKRYSRTHLAYLTALCALKQVLSVKDAGLLLAAASEGRPPQKLYEQFREELDRALDVTAGSLDGSAEAKEKQKGLWQYLREHTSAAVYRSIRFGFGGVTNLPFPKGDAIVVGGYRIARKIFKFN